MRSPQPFGHVQAIVNDDDAYIAAGIVMDAILQDAAVDSALGNSASLKPTDIVRDDAGNITHIVCRVRPRDTDGILQAKEDRVLVGVPA